MSLCFVAGGGNFRKVERRDRVCVLCREERVYDVFEELLRGNGSGDGDSMKNVPPKKGFEAPKRGTARSVRPGESKEKQYKMFDAFLAGKPDALDGGSKPDQKLPDMKGPPGRRPGEQPAFEKPAPPTRSDLGTSSAVDRPRAQVPRPKPPGVPSATPPRMKPNHPEPTYDEYQRLLSGEEALKWAKSRESDIETPVYPTPTVREGDVVPADDLRRLGIPATASTVACLVAPWGQGLSASWMNLCAEVSSRAAIADAHLVGVVPMESQKAVDRSSSKRSIRFQLVADEDKTWTSKYGQKRTYVFSRSGSEWRIHRIWTDVSAGEGHADQLLDSLKELLNKPSASTLVRPWAGTQAPLQQPLPDRRAAEHNAEPDEEEPLPTLRAPGTGRFGLGKAEGDVISAEFLDELKSELAVVTLAPHGVATGEWLRVLAELSARAMIPDVEFRGVLLDEAENFGKLRRKQRISFPLVTADSERFFEQCGQRNTYLLKSLGPGRDYQVVRVWREVAPSAGHAEEVLSEAKRQLKELNVAEPVEVDLKTPVRRTPPEPTVIPETAEAKLSSAEPPPMPGHIAETPRPLEQPPARNAPSELPEAAAEPSEEGAPATSVVDGVAEGPLQQGEVGSELSPAETSDWTTSAPKAPERPVQPPATPGDRDAIGPSLVELSRREMRRKSVSSRRQLSKKLKVNHSSNIVGLLSVLNRLCEDESILGVVPGEIRAANSSVSGMSLRVTRKADNGFKMIARQASSIQEVFVTTPLTRGELIQLVSRTFKVRQKRGTGRDGAPAAKAGDDANGLVDGDDGMGEPGRSELDGGDAEGEVAT